MFQSRACSAATKPCLHAGSDDDDDGMGGYSSDEHMFRCHCKSGLRSFLKKAKGMSKAEARDFVSQHFDFDTRSCTAEDQDELRSVTATVTFTNTVPHKTGDKDVSFTATVDYHSRARMYSYEHFASIKYTVQGPDTGSTTNGTILNSGEHPGVMRANRSLPFDRCVDFVEVRSSQLHCLDVSPPARAGR